MIENVAEASRDLYRTLLKAQSEMGEGFFVHEDGRLVYANEASSKITGYGPEELMALPSILELVIPEEREDLLERMSRRLANEPVVEHYESAIVRKDGRRADVEVAVKPFREGERTRLVVLMRDITERKEAEQALRESERRFSTLLANAPVYFYRCLNEPDWPNEFVSDYALELIGYPPEDLTDGSVMFGNLIVEEDRQRVWEEAQRALAERRRFRLRYAIRRRDGELRHVEDNGQGVYDQEGNLEALEGIVYDVTERERVEEALREAEARYRMLVEQVPAVIYIDGADETNSIIYRSPQIEAVLGYTPEELGSGSLSWQDLLHPDDRERVLEENERTNRTDEPFTEEASELRALGCDLAQGYHFWRPAPDEAAGALLAAPAG